MFRLTLETIRARKARFMLTAIAVVLGVAFVAGTFVLTDTIGKAYDGIAATKYHGTDALVRSHRAVDDGIGGTTRGSIPAAVLDDVRHVDGVAAADVSVEGVARLVGHDGRAARGRTGPGDADRARLAVDAEPQPAARGGGARAPGRGRRRHRPRVRGGRALRRRRHRAGADRVRIRAVHGRGHRHLRRCRRRGRRRGRGVHSRHRRRRARRARPRRRRATRRRPRRLAVRAGGAGAGGAGRPDRRGDDGHRRAGRGPGREPFTHVVHEHVPADLRHRRPDRGRVRDLQRLLDHRRAAYEGDGDAPGDRREPASGRAHGRPGVPRGRRRRLGVGDRARHRPRDGAPRCSSSPSGWSCRPDRRWWRAAPS